MSDNVTDATNTKEKDFEEACESLHDLLDVSTPVLRATLEGPDYASGSLHRHQSHLPQSLRGTEEEVQRREKGIS